jgi:hypothetical protein
MVTFRICPSLSTTKKRFGSGVAVEVGVVVGGRGVFVGQRVFVGVKEGGLVLVGDRVAAGPVGFVWLTAVGGGGRSAVGAGVGVFEQAARMRVRRDKQGMKFRLTVLIITVGKAGDEFFG